MIVPGSPLAIDHPFAWYAIVRHKTTGKERTYWMNGSQSTREQVAALLADRFPNVEVLTLDRADGKMPDKVLTPVPPEDFEYGIREAAEKELRELANDGGPPPIIIPPIARVPLNRSPLARQSLRTR